MARLVGWLIEGSAASGAACFRIVLPRHIAAAVGADLREVEAAEGIDGRIDAPAEDYADPAEGEPPPAALPDGRDDGFADTPHDRAMRALADFANRTVEVDVWLSLHPFYRHLGRLDGRRLTIFPDAIATAFPSPNPQHWEPDGASMLVIRHTRRTLSFCDGAITFSRRSAADLHRVYGFPAEKIHPIDMAPPDLMPLLPFLPDRCGNAATRRRAADLLRRHARERGWLFLAGFPFEEVPYIAVSTQDRITKNLAIVADALLLLRRDRFNIKVITTAAIDPANEWSRLPGLVEREQLQLDFLSMP
ncbi:MAG TPA: hypothetical protein VF007_03935, partial [Stellaceae bacterium]